MAEWIKLEKTLVLKRLERSDRLGEGLMSMAGYPPDRVSVSTH